MKRDFMLINNGRRHYQYFEMISYNYEVYKLLKINNINSTKENYLNVLDIN